MSVRKKCLQHGLCRRRVCRPRTVDVFFCFVGNDFRLFPRLAAGECVGGWIGRTRGNPAGLLLVREATDRPSIVREITTGASVQAGKRFLAPQQHLEGGSNNSRGGRGDFADEGHCVKDNRQTRSSLSSRTVRKLWKKKSFIPSSYVLKTSISVANCPCMTRARAKTVVGNRRFFFDLPPPSCIVLQAEFPSSYYKRDRKSSFFEAFGQKACTITRNLSKYYLITSLCDSGFFAYAHLRPVIFPNSHRPRIDLAIEAGARARETFTTIRNTAPTLPSPPLSSGGQALFFSRRRAPILYRFCLIPPPLISCAT